MISRAQFMILAGALYDAVDGGATPATGGHASGSATPPKFDTSITRKGGMVQWASETDLEGLIFWKKRADEPASDPKYEESNQRQSRALSYWISYRQADPMTPWSGERNRVMTHAKAPTAKPDTYPRSAPTTAAPAVATPSFDEGDDEQF